MVSMKMKDEATKLLEKVEEELTEKDFIAWLSGAYGLCASRMNQHDIKQLEYTFKVLKGEINWDEMKKKANLYSF